jgi:hypothetical protein
MQAPKTTEWLRSSNLKVGDHLNTNWYKYNRQLANIAIRHGWLSRSTVMMQTGPAHLVLATP